MYRSLIVLAILTTTARAQDPDTSIQTTTVHASAHRRTEPITIDGKLDEKAWVDCPPTTGFVQRFPDAGKPPEHDTEFRVEYDDENVYVAVHAKDNEPDKIRGLLTRRDQMSSSDWIMVGIDSYHDRRTGYGFGVNPAGVQRDLIIFDDQNADDSWDAVWTVATSIDRDGWTAEFEIPLSQLRFSPDDQKSWGFQVQRVVARSGEEDVWSPWPKSSNRVVSKFGTLEGMAGLEPARRVEILPYVTGGGVLEESIDAGDPFMRTARARGNAGLDAKLGLGSAFTLAATINPDFGQVEADPSQVNLTANELFFPEKRPFFLEGTDIFQYSTGNGDGPSSSDALFYTRRIGAAPHGDTDDYAYVDAPQATTIYGAAKISGKTSSGWSLGVLDAVTGEERARVDADGDGMITRPIVEPLSNYAVMRVKKDLREGRTTIGGAITATNRALGGTGLEPTMHDQAYTGGVQLQHRFGKDDLIESNVRLFGSWIHGTTDAISDTEENIRHLYQRPDQGYLHLDPNATSLAGSGFLVELGRFQGPGWHYGTGFDSKSPGLETNDLGFQRLGDYYLNWAFVEYRKDEPSKNLLAWSASLNAWVFTNYQPLLEELGSNLFGHATFTNHWDVMGGVTIGNHRWDPMALRGGPALRDDAAYNVFTAVTSDTRKWIYANANLNATIKPAADTWNANLTAGVTVQARSNLDLFLGPSALVATNGAQYVDQEPDTGGTTRYVFATIDEVVTSLTMRANWTFSPHVSLQVYAMPFVATGHYYGLKEATDTHASDYASRFHVYGDAHVMTTADDILNIDRDGDGTVDLQVGKPDFTVRELRSNVVLRWEYRPGSALFFIWSHDGEGSDVGDGRYRFGSDLSQLARTPGEDVVMMKLNYWVGL